MKVLKSNAQQYFDEQFEFVEDSEILRLSNQIVGSRVASLDFETSTALRKTRQKRSCRKSRYRDLEEAIKTLHRIERYRKYTSERGAEKTHRREKRAYFCPTCQGAHLTSQTVEGEVFQDVAA